MLVLNRKENESLNIGHDIEVKVLKIAKKQVRIGIKAPLDLSVHREEIYRKIMEKEKTEKGNG